MSKKLNSNAEEFFSDGWHILHEEVHVAARVQTQLLYNHDHHCLYADAVYWFTLRISLDRCIGSEKETVTLREEKEKLKTTIESLNAALHELGRENQSLQVSV